LIFHKHKPSVRTTISMRIIFIILLFTSFSIDSISQNGKELDNENGNSMRPIVNGIYETIASLEKENVEIVRIEFDRIIDKKASYRNFVSNFTYGIMVYGDYKVKNIEVKLYQKDQNTWKLIAKGENSGKSSIVHFEPDQSDIYKIEIEVLEYKPGYSGCNYGLIIIHN